MHPWACPIGGEENKKQYLAEKLQTEHALTIYEIEFLAA
jgi:hypothetical protein